ncbi:MAG: DUF4830 domain-containing protein [Oscillospiraceae bacterium]
MIVYTAKFSKKKAIIAVLILGAVLCAIILLAGERFGAAAEASSLSAVVKTNEDRVSYLCTLGWDVSDDPVDQQTITIPRDFSGVYGTYNEIQLAQGFDLREYAGREAVRYTYEVSNYPSAQDVVVADIIVYRNEIIAGDVQSTALDGFMQGLDFPKSGE